MYNYNSLAFSIGVGDMDLAKTSIGDLKISSDTLKRLELIGYRTVQDLFDKDYLHDDRLERLDFANIKYALKRAGIDIT